MVKIMEEHTNSDNKKIKKIIQSYIETKEISFILELESSLAKLFDAENVKIWKYTQDTESLLLIGKEDLCLSLDQSLTKKAIQNKELLISDHITSNKYYVQTIDNPFKLKLKAMITFPLIKDEKVIGIIKLWKGTKQKKNFTKKEVAALKSLAPLFTPLFDDKHTLAYTQTQENVFSNTQIENKPVTSNETFKELHKLYRQIQEENEVLKKEKKTWKNEYKKLQGDLEEYKEHLKKYKAKYKSLENDTADTFKKLDENEKKIKKLASKVSDLHNENKILKTELKEEKKKLSENSLEHTKQKLFLQNRQQESMNKEPESLLYKHHNIFFENEYTYLFLETILYSLESKDTTKLIEKELRDSKILYELIHEQKFLKRISIHEEKYRIDVLVKNLESYEKKIFSGAPKLHIDVAKDMPSSLIIDAQKVENLLFHLLIDMYQFIDHTKTLKVGLSYKDKLLKIEMGASVHQKNSLFEKMFKKMNMFDDRERLSLKTAKKLASRLNGSIDIEYNNEYYTFTVILPAKIIKIT